ncbi:MAG TPA: glycosyltransferase 87 family protein [Pseudonocardia sp.]|jgi:alpha-1,2-mannosyltransferase|nr:glycosyltransferase 87 family protein [Pseudonocardia sp.]
MALRERTVGVIDGLRERSAGLFGRLRERPELVYWVSILGLLVVITWMGLIFRGRYLDLEVYRLGVQTWLRGGDLYGALPPTRAGVVLPYIYPPFAAILMVPLAALPWHVAVVAMFAVSMASLACVIYLVVRRLWPSLTRSGALAVTSIVLVPTPMLEPISQTFSFGQINLELMALVALDCLVRRPRWPRGVLVGIAMAIKLTPGIFLLYFLLRRDYRAALMSVVSAAVATGIGLAVAPSESLRYWGGGISGTSGVSGSPFITNETFQAVLVRAGFEGITMKVLWLLLSALIVFLAAPAIRRGEPELAMVVTAGAGLLISPTSWSHHYAWIVPALMVMAASAWRFRSSLWSTVTAVLAVVFVLSPFHWLPRGPFLPNGQYFEMSWTPAEKLVGATYVIVTAAVYVLLWWTWRQRADGQTPRSGQVESSAH